MTTLHSTKKSKVLDIRFIINSKHFIQRTELSGSCPNKMTNIQRQSIALRNKICNLFWVLVTDRHLHIIQQQHSLVTTDKVLNTHTKSMYMNVHFIYIFVCMLSNTVQVDRQEIDIMEPSGCAGNVGDRDKSVEGP